ncbi:MAG: glycoside hydrolase family 130 protein [Clostridia bacterium]|nr:glycoside hydrolase family 130 protein [Clostridia bacterium]
MFHSASVIKRHPLNPVLTEKQVPYDADLIFNAGVQKIDGTYYMLFRNDYCAPRGSHNLAGTNIGLARSDDGVHWTVDPEPHFALKDDEIRRIYDPRLQVIDGEIYICFAVDTWHGIRGGIAKTDKDFRTLDILSMSAPDNRNMVLFPEKINGMYARLERPFPVYSRGYDIFDVWFSDSADLKYWGNTQLVLPSKMVPFANAKVGPAAPPIKTKEGWLTTFHAVRAVPPKKDGWEEKWGKEYYAGIMLLDLKDPTKVVGLYNEPLLAPEADYETKDGFRNNVIFPGGMILEDNGEVKIYYGAADTVECLATANVDDLIALCLQNK